MSNDIIPVEQTDSKLIPADKEWAEILDGLISELEAKGELPDKVVQATEYLLAGWPMYKVAKKLKITTETIRRWISTYPTMALVLANGRRLLTKWRMAKLEQQFMTAIERSQEILEVGLDGFFQGSDGLSKADPKILTVIAAQARYLIGLFSGQKVDVTVTHELGNTVLKAKEDALNYLAERLAQQEINAEFEPIEAVVRVIDSKVDNNAPVLDEQGNPPFGRLGAYEKTDDGTQCHICGKYYKNLARHILTEHNTSAEEYELTYLLPDGSVRKQDES